MQVRGITFIFLFAYGCAIETGNPKKPRPGDKDELRATADLHVRQAVEIASNETQNAAAASLQLQANNNDQLTCTKSDSNLVSTKTRKNSYTLNSPETEPVWQISVTQDFSNSTTWTAKQMDALSCSSSQLPVIIFDRIELVNVGNTFDQSTSRIVKKFGGDEVVQTDRLKKKGSISMTLKKADSTSENVALESSSSFNIAIEYSVDKKETPQLSITTNIKTPENGPIIVGKETDTTGNVSKTTILSGIVNSTDSQGRKLESQFSNVEVDLSKNCTPISGTVLGSIYESKSDTTPSSTYKITFSESTSNLEFPDGSVEEILVAGCGLF